ncbi:MAG: hypothetical protein QOH51_1760 [Acidobacteriota bacterium]|jgi:hypothetical protein|nr:hypothetical protein [Acidobacteriota bacterium]
MGGGDLELKSTFEKWAGGDEADAVAQAVRERHCIHHLKGETGESFGGKSYVAALQRLKGSEAMSAARNVEPFFWSDASLMKVWLCGVCAEALGLKKQQTAA